MFSYTYASVIGLDKKKMNGDFIKPILQKNIVNMFLILRQTRLIQIKTNIEN